MFCELFTFLKFLSFSHVQLCIDTNLVIWRMLQTLPTVQSCKTEDIEARLLLMINKSRCKASNLHEKRACSLPFINYRHYIKTVTLNIARTVKTFVTQLYLCQKGTFPKHIINCSFEQMFQGSERLHRKVYLPKTTKISKYQTFCTCSTELMF